jgi:pimeloyl-ACP methyl ester carboxylesterase
MPAPSPVLSTSFDISGPDGTLRAQRWAPADPAAAQQAERLPMVVLVHGYPDNRSEWAPVAEQLAQRYQVVAYDVRGAGESFKPTARAAYRLEHLEADFTAVLNTICPVSPGQATRPVHLVGHDWGSVQGWEFVTSPALKGRIASYTSCSGPGLDHTGFWARDSLRSPGRFIKLVLQLLKSWYVFFFQLPWLPELQWRLVMGRAWPTVLRWIEGAHIAPRPTQASDGALGVNLYRANVFQRIMAPKERFAHAPVLLLVPRGDLFISPWMTQDLARWVPTLQRIELRARHWLPMSDPALFAGQVRQFIEGIDASSSSSHHD